MDRKVSNILPPIIAGLISVIVNYGGTFILIFQAAQIAGLNPEQTASWVWSISIGAGITGIILSWYTKEPIITAWSTPAAAFLVTAIATVSCLRDLLVDDFIFTPTISSRRARLRKMLFKCIFFGANSTTISTLIIALVTTSTTSTTTKLLLHLLIILFTIFHENVENLFQIHILLSIKARRNDLSEVIDRGEEVVKTNSILTLLTISNRIQFIQHLSDSHRRAHDIGRIPTNVVRCHLTGSHMMEQKSKNFDTSQYSQSNRMNSLNEFLSIFKNRNGIRLCIQTNSHLIILDRLTLHHSVKLKE